MEKKRRGNVEGHHLFRCFILDQLWNEPFDCLVDRLYLRTSGGMVAVSAQPACRKHFVRSPRLDSDSGKMDLLHMWLWDHRDVDVLSGISAKRNQEYFKMLQLPIGYNLSVGRCDELVIFFYTVQ